jgi:predicted phage terminase large subunit-like protein
MTTLELPGNLSPDDLRRQVAHLRELAADTESPAEAREVISRIAQLNRRFRTQNASPTSPSPIHLAHQIDPGYQVRPHLQLLNDQIVNAVRDVERGQSRQLAVSMPPRAGKSTMTSNWAPLWLLQRHPEWSVVMTSYDGGLTSTWARNMRHTIEDHPDLGVALKRDGGAGGKWNTVEGGGMYTVGIGGALTGRGARVLIIDDPISDFSAAHSPRIRQNLWNWWLSVAQTRLEPPYLVLVTMTRWHEDDFVGRLLSKDHEGDPADWERVVLPALADSKDDILGREEGEPLFSPLLQEDRNQALDRWADVKRAVGTYTFSAMYQQRPAPQEGAIFNMGWWRYWSSDPSRATPDGQVVYFKPGEMHAAQWVDSWDLTFKGGGTTGDWVVGQRWVKAQANRYLVAQRRGRWTFTQTLAEIQEWAKADNDLASPYGRFVHERLIENTANGPAIMDVLHEKISGLKGINPHASKEARARSVTPEIESGNVYLPHPDDPGNEWVLDLLGELRNFPYDAHDDQVDALTQALAYLRSSGTGGLTVPGRTQDNGMGPLGRQTRPSITRAATTGFRRY